MSKKSKIKQVSVEKAFENSINNFVTQLGLPQQFGVTLSQTATLMKNNRDYLLSNDRLTLTYAYLTHGILQTLIDVPVDDAFRGGIDIDCKELDEKQIQELQDHWAETERLEAVKYLWKWTRLYGGGGIIINAPGNPSKPLNPNQINEDTLLEFYPADLWELNMATTNQYGQPVPYVRPMYESDTPYNYYGVPLHRSRVLKVNGKQAPSFLRPSLRGWAMSEVERLVRDLNQYLKNQDLVFELLDEAKIDVFKISGFNSSVATDPTGQKAARRVQAANKGKDYQNAIVLDSADEYEQKQIQFTGLAEMLQEIRRGIANSLRMPMTKIFGQSPEGMSATGESDIENYNSMIEGEIRTKCTYVIVQMLKLDCQKLFGFMPDQIQIEYKPLRILDAEQEENVKDKQFSRLMQLHDKMLLTANEFKKQCNLAGLTPVEMNIDEMDEEFPSAANEKNVGTVSDVGTAENSMPCKGWIENSEGKWGHFKIDSTKIIAEEVIISSDEKPLYNKNATA